MKKLALVVMVIAVAFMFAGIADAATSSSCTSCAKPACSSCSKGIKLPNLFPSSCGKCAKPACSSCAKPCNTCKPCAKPCAPICVEYKRDVLGQKTPLYTYTKDGSAMTDKATQYENTLISGQ